MDSSVSSASTGNYSGAAVQFQRRQAEQAARQAELRADTLQREAANARKEANASEQRADSLQQQAGAAGKEARSVRQGLAVGEGFQQLGSRLEQTTDRLASALAGATATAASISTPASPSPLAPTVNSSGQLTGQLINVTA